MTPSEIAERLHAKPTANGWAARCPAHDDKTASLSISEGTDGRTLLKCFAGCEFKAIIAAAGLKTGDLFPPKQDKARIVKTYDYTDAGGRLLYQVVRMEPKTFRQRRPDESANDGWQWNMKGISRVLYRLPDVRAAVQSGRAVFITEGEKDADAIVGFGLTATTNVGGAGKWETAYTETLRGAKAFIVADKDAAGRKHAASVADALRGIAESVIVIEMPDRDGHNVKDAADWIAAGGTLQELREIAKAASKAPPKTDPATGKARPRVFLPQSGQRLTDCAIELGSLMGAKSAIYQRGGALVGLEKDDDGYTQFKTVVPAALASMFEDVADLFKTDSQGEDKPAICHEATAKLISAARPFREQLPPIRILTRCPVLIERDGHLLQIIGYDRQSGIYADAQPAPEMPIEEAIPLILETLDGFKFATGPDKTRAIAAMIAPALVFGGLMPARCPIDMGEADDSQSGKGYRLKIKAALYNQKVRSVNQQKGGVGSMEETFNGALVRGATFVSLDNVRGKIDSPAIESFLTEDVYQARVPFQPPVEIDPRRVMVMMTSNAADMTRDLANRCSCVRILKHDDGHEFAVYPEGDILDHVRANQPRFISAVHAVIRAWHAAGKPRTNEHRHDFRQWAQTMDWIMSNVFGVKERMLDGHRETQARMTNPSLVWLRDVAIAVLRAGIGDQWLRTHHIIDIMSEAGIVLHGMPEGYDPETADDDSRRSVQQGIGRKLAQCFRAGDVVTIDAITITRQKSYDEKIRDNVKEYRFERAAIETEENDSIAAESPSLPF